MKTEESNTIQILDKSLKEGFSALPRVVLRAKGLSRNAKCLYALLLDYAWQEGSCFPGQERLAKDLDITRQTIVKDLIELKDFGLISWVQRGLNKTNIYYIQDLGSIFFGHPDVKDSLHPEVKSSLHQEVKEPLHLIEEDLIDSDKYTQPISINESSQSYKKNKKISKKLHLEFLDSEAIALSEELNDRKNAPYYQSVINKRNKGEITDNQIQSALNSVREKLAVDKADGKNFWKNPGAMFNRSLQKIISKSKLDTRKNDFKNRLQEIVREKTIEPEKTFNEKRIEIQNQLKELDSS